MACSIGIDLGGTFTKLALVAPGGEMVQLRRVPSVAGRDPYDLFSEIRAALEEMAAAAGMAYPLTGGCGIGIPGVVDRRSGFVTLSGPLGWKETPAGEAARRALGCEVTIDTDANAGALADLYYGAARDASDMLYISWGTGIGAGLVFARRLYHTRGGAMCNIGHVLADPESTRECYCGLTGCLEAEAGGRAMVRQAEERLRDGVQSRLQTGAITPETIAGVAADGDATARAIVERAAVLMARAIGGAAALLNPDTVVLGGGVSRCLPVVRETFDAELRARTPVFTRALTAVRPSAFGDAAGVLGASALPLDANSVT